MLAKKPPIINLLLIGLATVSLWLMLTTKPHAEINHTPNTASSFGTQITFHQFSPSGKNIKTLNAQQERYFASTAKSAFINPRLFIHGKNGENWLIQSKYATAQHNTTTAKGNVIIKQYKNKQLLSTIYTPKATYLSQQQTLLTHQPVIIKRALSTTHGIGLVANLKTNTYRILADTQIVYH